MNVRQSEYNTGQRAPSAGSSRKLHKPCIHICIYYQLFHLHFMHINICDTHDTLKQTRGKMMLQVNATNQLLKTKNKSKTSKHLECKNCCCYDKVAKNILSPPHPPHHPNKFSLYRIFIQQNFYFNCCQVLPSPAHRCRCSRCQTAQRTQS